MGGQRISDIWMYGTFFGEHLTVRREICEHTQTGYESQTYFRQATAGNTSAEKRNKLVKNTRN